MNLEQWSNKTGIVITDRGIVLIDENHPQRSELWSLDDYTPASCSGRIIRLEPKNPPNSPKFPQGFDKHIMVGDWIETEYNGISYIAKIYYDNDTTIDDDDCHNPDQSVTGCSKAQQQKLLEAREAYSRGDWFYIGIVIQAVQGDWMVERHAASLWGIEANYPGTKNEYLLEVANELLPEAITLVETIVASRIAQLIGK